MRVYGGDAGSTRYSPLDQVNRDDVKNLKIAWIWRSDNFGAGPECKSETTPLAFAETIAELLGLTGARNGSSRLRPAISSSH